MYTSCRYQTKTTTDGTCVRTYLCEHNQSVDTFCTLGTLQVINNIALVARASATPGYIGGERTCWSSCPWLANSKNTGAFSKTFDRIYKCIYSCRNLWNFAQSTSVSLPFSVQNFKIIRPCILLNAYMYNVDVIMTLVNAIIHIIYFQLIISYLV